MLSADFHPETRYFYSLTEGDDRDFYEFLVQRLQNLEFEFLLYDATKDPLTDAERASGLPAFSYCELDDLTLPCLQILFTRLLSDCPEFYYAYHDELHFSTDSHKVRIGNDTPRYTPEEIRKYNAALDGIFHRFDGITDDFELELAVHDYVISHFHYDKNESRTGRAFDEKFTVIGFLERGCAVCEAYTFFLQYVLQKRGIPCAHLTGRVTLDDGTVDSHAWLAVRIKGAYYHLDATCNGTTEDFALCPYTHFNLTDSEIAQDRELQSEYYPGIVCKDTAHNYFMATNSIFHTVTALSEAATRLAKSRCGQAETAVLRFKAPTLTWSEIEAAVVRPIAGLLADYDPYFTEPDIYVIKLIFKKS